MSDYENSIPIESLRVFISSAQSLENGFAWSEIRRRIRDCLKQYNFLRPFILEDVSSSTSSLQLFQRQVEVSDIIVILVRGEVRKGTATEYALASKLKKPILVYFLDEDNLSPDVENLKKNIEKSDRCTYQKVLTFDGIEYSIRNHIIDDLIRTFQDKFRKTVIDDEIANTFLIPEDLTEGRIPSKADVAQFENCIFFLFDLLDISYRKDSSSETNKFGDNLIRWIIMGDYQLTDEEIINFVDNLAGMFSGAEWLYKRWEAIRYYNCGELQKALAAEDKALTLAKNNNEPSWIINNIIIDCRNLELEIAHGAKEFTIGKYQAELEKQEFMVCLPVLDRYLNEIYKQIEKDEFKIRTSSYASKTITTGILNALENYANYIFSAAIYGSYTHLMVARKILSLILQRYSTLAERPEFAFIALKEYLLAGDEKNYTSFIKSAWNEVYVRATAEADELWNLTEKTPITYRDSIKQAVIESIGLYFTDTTFNEIEVYLSTYAQSVYWGNSEQFFRTILSVLNRLCSEHVLNMIIPIIEEKRYHIGNKLSHIVMYLDYKNVSEHTLMELNRVLCLRMSDIIKNNGDPQMIAVLIKHNKEIFGGLKDLPGNGLQEVIQGLLFKINLGSEDWLSVLQSEIESARKQFEANNKPGVYVEFASDPYFMICKIIRENRTNDAIDQLIKDKFIPLAIQVLDSEVSISIKVSCVVCLCEVLNSFERRVIPLPTSLIEAIQNIDVQKGDDYFSYSSRTSLEIRVLMAKVQSGVKDVSELLQWCLIFNKLTVEEKNDIIDCIEKYLYQIRKRSGEIESLVVSIILQCVSESDENIRTIAYRCISYLMESKYQQIAIRTLDKAVFDPSSKVRHSLLNLCKSMKLPDDFTTRIVNLLTKDANYMIRKNAIEYAKNMDASKHAVIV